MELKLIIEGIRNWNSIKSTADFSTIERLSAFFFLGVLVLLHKHE
jgi:hypothetical protein